MEDTYDFKQFLDIVARLRGEGGCPWDREQTHASLKMCMIEEAYEVVEGINRYETTNDYQNLKEELGDVLLQVIMHSQIAREEGIFSIEDVIDEVSKKMIRRHPHVFGGTKEETSEEVMNTWEEIKRQEKNDKKEKDTLQAIPKAFPALIRADKILKKAEKNYVEKQSIKDTVNNIIGQLRVIEENLEMCTSKNNSFEEYETMIGSILLNVIRIAQFENINAEKALITTLENYIDSQEMPPYFIKE